MEFVNTAWALLPPIVAIVLALITKETYTSLFIGILVGGLLVAGFMPVATLNTIINDGLVPAVADNAGIFIFLVMLGILVALVNVAGGAAAFGKFAAKHIKSRVGTQIATFVLGILILMWSDAICNRSRSPEISATSTPSFSARFAMVPRISSAS